MGILQKLGIRRDDPEPSGKDQPRKSDGSVQAAPFRGEAFQALLDSLAGSRRVVVGVFGGKGAGKTITVSAVERCLTGGNELGELWLQIPPDSNPVKYVEIRSKGCTYLFVDCPGDPESADDLRDMGDAAAAMDAAILVIPCDGEDLDGAVRHIALIKATRIPNVILFLNKSEQEGEDADRLAEEVREKLGDLGMTFLGGPVPVVRSAALPALQDSDSPWGEHLLELVRLAEQCARP